MAADLARSGASAWSKLQSTMTSTASCIWDEKTKEEKEEDRDYLVFQSGEEFERCYKERLASLGGDD